MTRLLEQALARAGQLPENEQDAIAQLVLDEIESERNWDDLFSKSDTKLRSLADNAWARHEAGANQPLDPDKL